ncbi:MAG: M20/M25/M40 family metallo-hydrolase [Gemmatimonadales bacterium]|nr:MAG: M20/M25/M40 family metallo-hydrolase [Gemmatimonadales bacterium]
MERLASDPRIEAAFRIIEEIEPRTMEDLVTITEIPAPPFMEDERAEAYVEMLRDAGLDDVSRDDEGNVIGVRPGTVGDRVIVVSAHLDTVFPEGTDVTVEFRGDTLFAPGVGDDSRGLAMLLAVVRAMEQAEIETEQDVWFVGTVGEEGLGDLRGVKHLFREGGPQIDAFLSVDGPGDDRVINQALGSLRYRVTFSGPGGHSWGDFGMVNPAHAQGLAVQLFTDRAREFVASGPRTSYNVGRQGGGTSVNSVPVDVWMEVDMRSIDPDRLQGIGELFRETMHEALDRYNARHEEGPHLTVELDRVGDRPSGEIAPDEPLVQRAMAAAAWFGGEPSLERSSTDSNVPISLGIPAATVGRGGVGGGAHSLDEWWLNEDGHIAIQRTLLLVVAEAGLASESD